MTNPTTTLFLDSRRSLKNGTYPLKLTVYYLGKKKRYSSPFKLTEEEYLKMQGGKLRDADLKNLKNKIYSWLNEQTSLVNSLSKFSFTEFERLFQKEENVTKEQLNSEHVQPYFETYITKLRKQERIKTAESYQSALNSLLSFRRYLKFQEITPDFLEAYEIWMLSFKKSKTTIGIYLRSLRAIYNLAITDGIVEIGKYPFKKYTIPAPRKSKRALKEHQIKEVFNAKTNTEKEQRALDLWRFSFLCNGINLKDIALLKKENIRDQSMLYFRKKTEKTKRENIYPIKVHLSNHALDIIKKWGNSGNNPNDYVFPILDNGMSAPERESRIANFTKTTNKYLKRLGKSLNVPEKLTTYTARHSFATKLKNSEKVSLSFIMESLGHTSLKTTIDYLAGFEDDKIKKHHEVLMEGLEN